MKKKGSVVQLDRISDFGSEGWGFESLRGHKLSLRIIIYFWRYFFEFTLLPTFKKRFLIVMRTFVAMIMHNL